MSASSTLVNLDTAKQLTINAQAIIDQSLTKLRQACSKDGKVRSALLDQHQWVSFDLARSAAEVSAARHMLEYAERLREKSTAEDNLLENQIAAAYCSEMFTNLSTIYY